MNWKTLIEAMLARGESEASIASKLTARGAECSQSTVNRLKTGRISEPKHTVGEALKALHNELFESAA